MRRFRTKPQRTHPCQGWGTASERQIFLAKMSGISLWRGTASTWPVRGFSHSEWDAPSRLRMQPWCRKC